MNEPARLLVVSNRLPVSLIEANGQWQTKRSSGGLATAMDPLLKRVGGIWVGWSGIAGDSAPEVQRLLREEQSSVAVNLSADIIEKFYEGYSNQALWPLFHSFSSKLHFNAECWDAYITANRLFCDVVVAEYRPGDRIWVHDYHLMLLPEMLRRELPEAAIGFFLHTPFPSSDIFPLLPRGEELLSGVLGSDLISFHTHSDLQHFRTTLRRLLSLESAVDRIAISGREVRLQALPIGISPTEFLDAKEEAETGEQLDRLRKHYSGLHLLLAVDRLDYTKGIPNRLRTFRRLLWDNPDLIGKIVLLQVAIPSRENIGPYQDLRDEVHASISEVNGEFGTADWVPIVYIHRGIPRAQLVALYQLADLIWVSPLRDGMNLVAKEYVACHGEGGGALVLSSFAGAAPEMGEAFLINPFDEQRTAETVRYALFMNSDEKRSRMLALHERVLRNDVFAWGDRFLSSLDEAAATRERTGPGTPSRVSLSEVVAAYRGAAQRFLAFDYDGTLVPITSRPQDACPDSQLIALLRKLADDRANAVFVVSGRRTADLDCWFGQIPRLGLAAEHGARWRLPAHDSWDGLSSDEDWKAKIRPILEHFVDRTPGTFIEEKEFALVWHYRLTDAEFGDWLAAELVSLLEGMLAETELRAFRGKKIVEVKPTSANKGSFIDRVLPLYPADFVLALGDDRTDEDLFAHLPEHAWSIHVGSELSKARYSATDPAHIRRLLSALSG